VKKPRRTPPSHFPTPFHRIGKISQRMRKPAPPFNRKARRIAATKARNQDK
jgi:hypothetical protein